MSDDFVERTRLFDVLDRGRGDPVTWITGPTGSGKTTLAAAWLRHLKRSRTSRVAWFSLDETDRNVPQGWAYLAAAIESAFPGALERTRAMMASSRVFSYEQIAPIFLEECAALPKPLTLVVNDFHFITTESVLANVPKIAPLLPRQMRIVLVSRNDATFKAARLGDARLGADIDASALKFTDEEASAFLTKTSKKPVPADIAQSVNQHLEGWVAGLRMVSIGLQGRSELGMRGYVREFLQHGNRYIADYLLDQVLVSQPEHVQSFLLRTSFLPRLTAELCAAALGDVTEAQCRSILRTLNEHNVFVERLDDRRSGLRYQRQFRAALQERFRKLSGAVASAEILRRSASWLADHGQIDDAVTSFVATNDFDGAEAVMAQFIKRTNLYLERPRIERWLRIVPADFIDGSVALCVARAWLANAAVASKDAQIYIDKAEDALARMPNLAGAEAQAWLGHIRLLRARHAPTSTPEQRIADLDAALALLPETQTWPRLFALTDKAMALASAGQAQQSMRLVKDAIASTPPEKTDLIGEFRFFLVYLVYNYGNGLDALEAAQQLLDVARAIHDSHKATLALLVIGRVHYIENNLEAAERWTRAALDEVEPWDNQFVTIGTYRFLEILLAQHKLDDGARTLAWFRGWHASWGNPLTARLLLAFEAWMAALSGQWQIALPWVRAMPADAPVDLNVDNYELLVLAQVLLASRLPENLVRADTLLTKIAEHYRRARFNSNLVMLLTWHAQVRAELGNTTGALDVLEEALVIGIPLGFARWFAATGPVVATLLNELIRANRHPAEAAPLFLAHQVNVPRTPATMPTLLDKTLLLARRETQVLELLARGLTNKQIAHELGLSPITVRNYTSSIYAKLQVRSRKQAVRHARALGLIATEP